MLARVAATLRERQAIRLAINPEGEEGGTLVLHENCNVSGRNRFEFLRFVLRRGLIELTVSPDDVNNLHITEYRPTHTRLDMPVSCLVFLTFYGACTSGYLLFITCFDCLLDIWLSSPLHISTAASLEFIMEFLAVS